MHISKYVNVDTKRLAVYLIADLAASNSSSVIIGRKTTSPRISIVASSPRLSTDAAYKKVSRVD